jgi:Tol biopolymer transport system component
VETSPGSRLGPYEIVSRIAAGGMGEVFKARDTRLDRSVAIKVLPAELAQNAGFRLRFEREARTISQLNHPNICTLYDVGDGYLVMELLDGESLADRLGRGPLPLKDVMRYGIEIAAALDRAHRAGVVHRDLKPGNVMLTPTGAKLLDFGLAKSSPVVELSAESTTQQKPLTQEGTILGTFQYMAPEQLEGVEVDSRTDIFALGAVLYEMATGVRAFEGKTKASLIAAIIERDPPPIAVLQPLAPPALDHVISRCLAKDRDDRWQSTRDIAEELRWIRDSGSQAGLPAPIAARKKWRERMAWAAAALLAITLGGGGALYVRAVRRGSRPLVTDLAAPRGMRFNAVGDTAGPAVISPDGKYVIYSVFEGGTSHLALRSLATGKVKAVGGTEGAIFPFWSPDSRNIAFENGSRLMRVDLAGGAPIPICPAAGGRGGAWSSDDWIVFSNTPLSELFRVRATGGQPQALTKVGAQHTSHRWPIFLDDGRRFLFLAINHQDPAGSANGIYLASLDGGEPRLVMRGVSNAVYSDGWLLFERESMLYAQRMKDDGTIQGDPVGIAADVLYDSGTWRAAFSVSRDGLLTYHTGSAAVISRLKWFGRNGGEIGVLGEAGPYCDVELSPSGQKLAVVAGDPLREIWIVDLQKNMRIRLPIEAGWMDAGLWSTDSSMIYLDVLRRGQFHMIERRLSGGERTIIDHSKGYQLQAMAPDGKSVLGVDSEGVLFMIAISGSQPPAVFARAGTPPVSGAAFSPNGRWIAYCSDESGHPEVYLASASDPRVKWQVSVAGGALPRFRGDGREMYYLDLSNRITAVPITENGSEVEIGTPQPLFTAATRTASRSYDVTKDGQRFLVNTISDQESPTVKLIADWKQRLSEPLKSE